MRSALDQLGAMGVTSVLLEGGPHLAGRVPRRRRDRRTAPVPRAAAARRQRGARPAGGRRASSASPRRCARSRFELRARRRRPADLRPAARVVRVMRQRRRRRAICVFTGLIADLGQRRARVERDDDGRARAHRARGSPGELGEGDSIAVNGVCLTATRRARGRVHAPRSMTETLSALLARRAARRRAGQPRAGAARRRSPRRPRRAGSRRRHRHRRRRSARGDLAGARDRRRAAAWRAISWRRARSRVDGVSLTVSALTRRRLRRLADPRDAAAHDDLARLEVGGAVNIEVDVLAKHVERLMGSRLQEHAPPTEE